MYKPEPHEFAPYYCTYTDLVTEDEPFTALVSQPAELRSALANVPEEKGTYAYAKGKWTIKEFISHLIDAERIFAYRILRISRGDKTPIEGFEQDDYIATSNANERTLADLLDEFELVRKSNVLMLRAMENDAWTRSGIASEKPVSTRALVAIAIGHLRHHLNVLRAKYLV